MFGYPPPRPPPVEVIEEKVELSPFVGEASNGEPADTAPVPPPPTLLDKLEQILLN